LQLDELIAVVVGVGILLIAVVRRPDRSPSPTSTEDHIFHICGRANFRADGERMPCLPVGHSKLGGTRSAEETAGQLSQIHAKKATMSSLEFREEDRGIPLGIRRIWIRILAVERWFGGQSY
jgi:hypothetical protein